MAEVWIPSLLRDLSGGSSRITVPGGNVRQVIDNLDTQFPGMKNRLIQNGQLMPGISVIVDNEQSQLGLSERVQEETEIHFLPAIGGGKK
ncbi:MAG: molybdopterin synthase sulfur carrier subunit [Chloroflexi bacterium]|jgi:molybdopterin synthase sulfur carrier subunit|nr:MAG: molybdopterin synthase sulfur carrier subunit [Chloroflexota bacterium]